MDAQVVILAFKCKTCITHCAVRGIRRNEERETQAGTRPRVQRRKLCSGPDQDWRSTSSAGDISPTVVHATTFGTLQLFPPPRPTHPTLSTLIYLHIITFTRVLLRYVSSPGPTLAPVYRRWSCRSTGILPQAQRRGFLMLEGCCVASAVG